MKVKKAENLFVNMIKGLHDAELQLEKTLPQLAKKASDQELARGIEEHANVSRQQRERLERIAEMMDFSTKGRKNIAMEGILQELNNDMKEIDQGELLDSELIIGAQKAEHYEIAAYGSACAMAKLLNNDQVLGMLHETLEEEKRQDQVLTELAERSINEKAMQV